MARINKLDKMKADFEKKCNDNDKIISCVKNPVEIKYNNHTTGKVESFFPDFKIEYDDKTMIVCLALKENTIAPESLKEGATINDQKKYSKNMKAYLENIYKWDATNNYCKSNGYEFRVFTEEKLKNLGIIK